MRTTHRTCPICDATCGLRITLGENDLVRSIHGDDADPFSQGYICPKGASLGRIDEDPDRLRVPLVREGDTFREASWDEAFELIDRELSAIIAEHGRDAVALYFGNPTYHTMAGFAYRAPLTQSLGTRNVYSAGTIDHIPKHIAMGNMVGDPFAFAVPDIDRTDYLLVLGANPLVSQSSLFTAPDMPGRVRALRARGGKLVVVDPRRTRTAKAADEHFFIRPGTDVFLLFGIVHTLLAEDLATPGIDVAGLDELRAAVAEFSPESAAPRCGVPAADIARLARELAAAPAAAVYARMGASVVEFGTLTQWLVDTINILTGNFDRPGGVMFTKTACLEVFRSPERFTTGRWHSRVHNFPEALGELPVATLADEIETPGDGQVRSLICLAGNLALSAPNAPRLEQALSTLDFMVCVDPYLNETTRHANVILPPPRILQTPHYDFLIQTVMTRNYTRYSPAALPLDPDQRSEAEILARLTLIVSGAGAGADPSALDEGIVGQILGAIAAMPDTPLTEADAERMAAGLTGDSGPERLLDLLLKLGPYGLSLAKLQENPHGIDLGPLEPRLKELLNTESGVVELAPAVIVADIARLRARFAEPPAQFLLIGRRQLRSNNSWLHNTETLVGGSNTCTLQIHPEDARQLGLTGTAVVRSAAGALVAPVELTDSVMRGVVSLPHGWGHHGGIQRVATANAGVNANALTDDRVRDVPSGNAVFNGVPVTISAP